MTTGARTRTSGRTTDDAVAVTEDVAATGRNGAATLGKVITAPVTVLREVADDVAGAARRPDAVVYWGGLAALTALGAIELPVAAAIGVGVAVAGGIRSARRA